MSATSEYDRVLIQRVRRAEPQAWEELISRYEGRLLAFVESRVGNRASAEDIVQESFIGFLTSLPNYDMSRALESYLFSIAAHKLTDHLRRQGRRPTVPLVPSSSESRSTSSWDVPGKDRPASSIVRSGERRHDEEEALAEALAQQLDHWRQRDDWQKIQIVELLFVRGWANKDVAESMGISEQAVANCKFDFLSKMQTHVRRAGIVLDDMSPT